MTQPELPAAADLPDGALESAVRGASAMDHLANTPYGQAFLAHALAGLQRDGWLRDGLTVIHVKAAELTLERESTLGGEPVEFFRPIHVEGRVETRPND